MKIEKSTLIEALNTVKPGLSNKDLIEQSTAFCFKDGKVITFNDEVALQCPVDLDIEGAVNSVELYAFLNKVSSKEVDLELTESEILLKAGRSKAGLSIEAEIVLPYEEIGDIKKWNPINKGLLKAIKFCMNSCSRDMSQPVLTCVHVDEKKVEASDQYRIAAYNTKQELPINPFLLPASVCRTVLAFKPVEISEGQGWVHFKNEKGAILSCRILEEKFPPIAVHMEVEGEEITFPEEIKGILERAMVFSKKDNILDESVTVMYKKGLVTLRSESGTGWFEEKAKTNYKGDDVEFVITPYLLQDILDDTNVATLDGAKLLFSGKGWAYLTMLRNDNKKKK